MARLSRDTLLSIHLDAICSRNRYTRDPGPVIDELRTVAGERSDLLGQSVGTWVGSPDLNPGSRLALTGED